MLEEAITPNNDLQYMILVMALQAVAFIWVLLKSKKKQDFQPLASAIAEQATNLAVLITEMKGVLKATDRYESDIKDLFEKYNDLALDVAKIQVACSAIQKAKTTRSPDQQ